MAITGAHMLLYTSKPEELRAMLRDVFEFDHVDAGDGWLVFALPPSEIGVHPADRPSHEITFMCDDIETTVATLRDRGVDVSEPIKDEGFGLTTTMVLPGEVRVMLYEPRHPTAN